MASKSRSGEAICRATNAHAKTSFTRALVVQIPRIQLTHLSLQAAISSQSTVRISNFSTTSWMENLITRSPLLTDMTRFI